MRDNQSNRKLDGVWHMERITQTLMALAAALGVSGLIFAFTLA